MHVDNDYFGTTPIYLKMFIYFAQKLWDFWINKMEVCSIEKAKNW